jgi:hypothetical protein
LTEITKSAWPSARHFAAWRQASSSTHSPIRTIRPLCSAIGTKQTGETAPSRVLPAQQRLDAEHLARVGEHDLWLVGERACRSRRRALGLKLGRSTARERTPRSKNSSWALPCSLA